MSERPGVDPSGTNVNRSMRDPNELRRRLQAWLSTKVDDPDVGDVQPPQGNGMSSDTVLFNASWRHDGTRRRQACAARLAPPAGAAAQFPVYDLEKQFRVIRLVGARSTVPVPPTMWLETDPEALGAPFFVMERVEGVVPPDVMPYPMGSWLSEAAPVDQRRLQDASVRVLADLHAIELAPEEAAFLHYDLPGDTPLRRHVAELHAYYRWVASDGVRSPLIERALGWLDEHWPTDTGDAVVSWGDARIGNIVFRDFEPVAVLDWEMVGMGPRELDLAWMIFLHRFLDDIALQAGLPGMPGFMRMDDVAATYEHASGYTPRDLEWFTVYAAVRHAAIMSRIARRQAAIGEAPLPDDPDDTIMHRATLESMLAGTYWRRF